MKFWDWWPETAVEMFAVLFGLSYEQAAGFLIFVGMAVCLGGVVMALGFVLSRFVKG